MKAWAFKAALGAALCGVLVFVPENAPISATPEVPIQRLAISGGPELSEAELSGLAWFDDQLVLLPQYPSRFPTADGGGVFVVPERDVEKAIDEQAEVHARLIPFVAEGVEEAIDGFEGFEAIAFEGSEVFVTVERDLPGDTRGYILRGRVRPGLSGIDLDVEGRAVLEPQSDIGNLAYEALAIHHGRVYVFYEANGAANPHPEVLVFDTELNRLDSVPLGHVEYRITDATSVDRNGRFWAANYYYEGDCWKTESCPMRERYGVGRTHQGRRGVERLVELQITSAGVQYTDAPPIELELARGPGRNWEGIVRLEGRGFLVVTDQHPESMLAFVPKPE